MAKRVTNEEILQDLKRVFNKLGRAFTTGDYSRHGSHHRDILPARFGSFDKALEEAGLKEEFREVEAKRRLEVAGAAKTKISDLKPKWAVTKRSKGKRSDKKKVIFVIGDLHIPFMDEEYIEAILEDIAKRQPDYVIQIGDMWDFFNFSRFNRSTNVSTPNEEFVRGKMLAEKLWTSIKKIVPKAKLIQLCGNHENRLMSRLIGSAPELESFFSFQKPLDIKGVHRLTSQREHIELFGIVFCHGFLSQPTAHAKHYAKSCVYGHSHRGGIYWLNDNLFELNVGHGVNTNTLPFSYTQSTVTKWKMGYGVIEIINGKHFPYFIPFYKKDKK